MAKSSKAAEAAAVRPIRPAAPAGQPTAVERQALLAGRPNLADSLVDTLRALIVDGELPAGGRINEVQLAGRLGVSRTPLREALNRLVSEEALVSVPRIGYIVRPLTVEELQQIYAIRPLLDPEALRLSGIPPAARMKRLRLLNREIARADRPDEIIALDDQWHLELIADCPNQVLVGLIRQFMRRTNRYELALMRETKNVRGATVEHEQILAALQDGHLKPACDGLRRNMQSGFAPLMTWMQARQNQERT
jgi:DNA-binding GntR family transcriptional regulator